MLNRIISDVAGGHFLAIGFSIDQHLRCHGGAVLDQFIVILATNAMDCPGNSALQSRDDFVNQYPTCLGTHSLWNEKTHPMNGWVWD